MSFYRLTDRELEVLRAVKAGNTDREIAKLLKISQETVNTHMDKIFRRMGAKNRRDAVRIAMQDQFL